MVCSPGSGPKERSVSYLLSWRFRRWHFYEYLYLAVSKAIFSNTFSCNFKINMNKKGMKCVISSFHREVGEKCALLGCYTAGTRCVTSQKIAVLRAWSIYGTLIFRNNSNGQAKVKILGRVTPDLDTSQSSSHRKQAHVRKLNPAIYVNIIPHKCCDMSSETLVTVT